MSVFRFMKTYDLRQTMEDRLNQKQGYGHVLDFNRLYDLCHQRQVYHSSHLTSLKPSPHALNLAQLFQD